VSQPHWPVAIGAAISRTFARGGARLVLAGRSRANLGRDTAVVDALDLDPVGNVAGFVAPEQGRTATDVNISYCARRLALCAGQSSTRHGCKPSRSSR
jgi:NAD(P)-dependent dehydrogenase (short-subunit alcohol dehydrogenase family)